MKPTLLPYGAAEPLAIEIAARARVADLAGPEGVTGTAAARVIRAAVAADDDGPPLAAHAVPGDRVVIAVSGTPPQARDTVATVVSVLVAAGVDRETIGVLYAAGTPPVSDAVEFVPDAASATAYLGADDDGQPVHAARLLVDADVVVTVGEWAHDASLGGRSLDGELWPAFGRRECRHTLERDLARHGRRALAPWLANLRAITWQLGVMACLRLVAGRDGSLSAAAFGTADAAARRARRAAAAWAPVVSRPADLAVCSLAAPAAGFASITRAVAAAARITRPGATICIAAAELPPPGPVVTRWREGAPLVPLVKEARRSGDQALVADAVVARLLAHSLDDRRLVLLSPLEETLVEELEFGHAPDPDAIARLARRAEGVAVLREADRLFPRLA